MNKTELVQNVAKRTGLPESRAFEAISSMFESIQQALIRQERVNLIGFGTFDVAHREARVGRNPRTGQEIKIPASKLPRFRPGKGLREAVS